MRKKLRQSYIMLSVTLLILPMILVICFFTFPLNHDQVVEHAQSLASGIDSHYYLSDEKIINNVDYLLFSMKDGSDRKVVIYTSKAPILSRYKAVSYIEMNNLETMEGPNQSIRITDKSLTIEKLPLIHGLMPLVIETIVWLAWVAVLLKRVISLRKTVYHMQSGGDIPE